MKITLWLMDADGVEREAETETDLGICGKSMVRI